MWLDDEEDGHEEVHEEDVHEEEISALICHRIMSLCLNLPVFELEVVRTPMFAICT